MLRLVKPLELLFRVNYPFKFLIYLLVIIISRKGSEEKTAVRKKQKL